MAHIDCAELGNIREKLNEYLDGALPEAERSAVESHLVCCPDCRAEYEALCSVRESLASLRREVPAGLHQAVIAAVEREKTAQRRARGRLLFRFSAAAAAVLLIAVLLPFALRAPLVQNTPSFAVPDEAAGKDDSTLTAVHTEVPRTTTEENETFVDLPSRIPPTELSSASSGLSNGQGTDFLPEAPRETSSECENTDQDYRCEAEREALKDFGTGAPEWSLGAVLALGVGRLHLVTLPAELFDRITVCYSGFSCGGIGDGLLFPVIPELRQELAAAGVPNTDGWQDGDRILLRVSD